MFPYIVIGGEGVLEAEDLQHLSKNRLSQRIAFVLSIGMGDEFDAAVYAKEEGLVVGIIEILKLTLDADEIKIEDMQEITGAYSSIAEFMQNRPACDTDGWQDIHVPYRIHLCRDSRTVGFAKCENWFNVGGPWPYHDSYTYSLYVESSEIVDRIVSAISDYCGNNKISEPKILKADDF